MVASVAVLSDIHGVLPALDAVLAEPAVRDAERIVLTGDIAAGPQPVPVLDRLLGLGDRVTWVRGNADRELVELARGQTTDVGDPIAPWAARQLSADHVDWLARLPYPVTLPVDGFGEVVFCHATPRDDEEVVVVDSRLDRWTEVLAGLPDEVMTVVCGHTHMPFTRLANRRQDHQPGQRRHALRPHGRALGPAGGRRGHPAAHQLRHRGCVRLGHRGVVLPGRRRVGRLLPARPGQRRRRARGHGSARRARGVTDIAIGRCRDGDLAEILRNFERFWGDRDLPRSLHHPMFFCEFGDTAFAARQPGGEIAGYLLGFVARAEGHHQPGKRGIDRLSPPDSSIRAWPLCLLALK